MRHFLIAAIAVMVLAGCAGTTIFPFAPNQPKPPAEAQTQTPVDEDIKWIDAGVTAVSVLSTAADATFGVLCPMGVISQDICLMEKIASARAKEALVVARAELAAYREGKGDVKKRKIAVAAITGAWKGYNDVNQAHPFM